MKFIICLTILILIYTSVTFSQSVMNYESGTGIEVQKGADICADSVSIYKGSFSGGGTICNYVSSYALSLTALVQGFYNSVSNIMVSDTARVYLRNANSPYTIVDSSITVLDQNGAGTFNFSNAANATDYYIVIRHRNSIETWSMNTQVFTGNTLSYDLTTAAAQAFGNNMIQVNSKPVRFAIYSGDVNQDGTVDLTDIIETFNDANNFVTGYVQTDLNGDDVTDLTDLIIAFNNSNNFVGVVRP